MHTHRFFCAIAILLAIGVGSVHADMVILKSGEMFSTRKAWEESGIVRYYRDGQVVQVDAEDVERVIHSQRPVEPQPRSQPQPTDDPSSSVDDRGAARPPSSQKPIGEDTGYLGLTWGQAPAQIDGLAFIETDPAYGGVRQYIRPTAKKRFGRARVDNVYYGFWKEELYTILVEVSNYMDFMDLKAEAFRRYGQNSPLTHQDEKYRWTSGGTDRLLAYDHQADTGYLWMRSQALHAKVRALHPE